MKSAMQTLNVSLVIRSKKISLSEMSKRLGSPENEISSEKGRIIRLPSKKTVSLDCAFWGMESKKPENEPIDVHLKEIIKKASKKAKLAKEIFGNKITISLRIGIFFQMTKTANAVCHFNSKTMETLLPSIDVIEVSAYPCQCQ